MAAPFFFGAKAGDEDMGDPADVDLFDFADEFAEVDPGVLQQEKVEEGHVEPDPVPELTPAEASASVEDRSQVAHEVMEQGGGEPHCADPGDCHTLPKPSDTAAFPMKLVSSKGGSFDDSCAKSASSSACLERLTALAEPMKRLSAFVRLHEGVLSKSQAQAKTASAAARNPHNQLEHELSLARQWSAFGGARTGRLAAWFDKQKAVGRQALEQQAEHAGPLHKAVESLRPLCHDRPQILLLKVVRSGLIATYRIGVVLSVYRAAMLKSSSRRQRATRGVPAPLPAEAAACIHCAELQSLGDDCKAWCVTALSQVLELDPTEGVFGEVRPDFMQDTETKLFLEVGEAKASMLRQWLAGSLEQQDVGKAVQDACAAKVFASHGHVSIC